MRVPAKSLLWLLVPGMVGLGFTGNTWLERRAAYLKSADWNQFQCGTHSFRKNIPLASGKGWFYNPVLFDSKGDLLPEYVREFEGKQRHFAALAAKYRYAAGHPWVDIELDPEAD